MQLPPPPSDIEDPAVKEWLDRLYDFLKFPAFDQLKYVPTATAPTNIGAGVKYYDSDDNKEKTYNGTAWQDNY